jgi:MFS family permease
MALKDEIAEANDSLDIGHRAHPPAAEPVRAASAGAIAESPDIIGFQLTTKAERNRAFTILFISLTCMGAGQTVLFNILPPLSRQLGLSEVQTTGIFSISALVWVFTSAYWGKKSDQWGRKPIMLMGLCAFATSFALFATVILGGLRHWLSAFLIFPLLITTRSIYGILGSGTSPASQAYVAGSHHT